MLQTDLGCALEVVAEKHYILLEYLIVIKISRQNHSMVACFLNHDKLLT